MRNLSFRRRLLAAAILWVSLGVSGSWLALATLLQDRVLAEMVEELDHHATELAELATLDAAGGPALRHGLSDHRFHVMGSGHYWQLSTPDGRSVASISLGGFRWALGAGAQAAGLVSRTGPAGPTLLLEREIDAGGARMFLGMGIEERLVAADIDAYRSTIGIGLMVIGAGLIAAVIAQISFGLQPLRRLRRGLAAIRNGEAERLPSDLPEEVSPLVDQLNALLAANQDVVRRARLQAGNLAHALKGPLAILLDEGRRMQAAGLPGGVVVAQVVRMQRQIDYQLARARAAGAIGSPGAVVRLGPTLDGLVAAISRLHRDRGLAFEVRGSPTVRLAACEVEDFEEMLGNLLDNAAKWARTQVRVSVVESATAGFVHLCVEDDGPGMAPADTERAFTACERLDESVPGSGLGLAIVRDIAQLYGGRAWIDGSTMGGLAAHLSLPVPAA